MHTKSSRRGAARVSAVWTIVAFVLFFVALGFGYIASDDAAKARAERDTAVAEAKSKSEAVATEIQKWRTVSRLFGFQAESENAPSSIEAATQALEDAKSAFPDTDGVKTFQELLPRMQIAYSTALKDIETKAARITDQENLVRQARSSTTDVQRTKDAELKTLQNDLTDERNNSRTQLSTKEATIATLTGERNRLDEDVKARQTQLAKLNKDIEEAKATMQSMVRNVTRERNDMRRSAERPDGEVTAVSEKLGRVWINLGAGDRLSEGVVFRVTGSDPADVKGLIEVVDVQPDHAVCRIVSLTDAFDPIVTSHLIWNDLYQAKGARYAVLGGRFDGQWNEKELRLLLADIGITVQDEININTDFLIAGSARAVRNDETDEMEIIEVSETPVYKDAIARGLTILSIRDVDQYFRK